jgi:hypothetical protein
VQGKMSDKAATADKSAHWPHAKIGSWRSHLPCAERCSTIFENGRREAGIFSDISDESTSEMSETRRGIHLSWSRHHTSQGFSSDVPDTNMDQEGSENQSATGQYVSW